ncbi:MAG: hypothetical protein GEU79_12380 [Acidimicrobiia bacterium]|nr:hypothetical protein [Acidimicrobiia bacterium]
MTEPAQSPSSRSGTATRAFGVSKRENHDSTAFYSRFDPPIIDQTRELGDRGGLEGVIDTLIEGDSRDMGAIPDGTVALVVTSPPYFVGKEYESDVANGRVPDTYASYLSMLEDVFAECVRILEPGGRMAVNVANLGRKPYRSLSGDALRILEDLGLLARGEVIWVKAKGASGSTAWGSFQSPVNPVLRDLTERILVVSKERFNRTPNPTRRREMDLPHESSLWRDEFIEATTDVWEMAAESATTVGHPAPFPVDLPRRVIELFTFVGDVVVDPFIGSGTTAVAAKMTGRHYIGYDTDPRYLERARERIAGSKRLRPPEPPEPSLVAGVTKGLSVRDQARLTLEAAGYEDIRLQVRHRSGTTLDLVALSPRGERVGFLIVGSYTSARTATRIDVILRQLGSAAAVRAVEPELPIVLLATDIPTPPNPAGKVLEAVLSGPGPVATVVELLGMESVGTLSEFQSSPT